MVESAYTQQPQRGPGEYMPAGGVSAPTIYDVAELANVSIATVSRVLNGQVSPGSPTHERVTAAVEQLSFVPNGAARGLSKGLKKVLGIVFGGSPATDDLVSFEEESLLFADAVVRGAESGAQRLGFSLLLSGAGPGASEQTLADLTGKVDGLILLDQVLPERRVAPIARRVPVVLLAGSGRSRVAYTVRVDNVSAMGAVAEHLVVVHGLRRLAFMSGLAASPDSSSRAESFMHAASELGATVEPLATWAGDWTSGSAARTTRARLEAGDLPQAIVCANDQMAIGAMHAAIRAGLTVPGDVAVVGFDDISVARHLMPPLTTVRQPSRQLGATAVDVLVDVVTGRPPADRELVLPTALVIRASCGCPPGPHTGADEVWQIEAAHAVTT